MAKMKKFIKLLSVVLVIALCATLLLAGCGTKDPEPATTTTVAATSASTAAATSAAPALEKVELTGVLLGDEQPDGPAVIAEVNKKLEQDINATLKLQYIAFSDMATKYPLVLASGQDWDFIYGNVNYAANAAKGGYREITMADIEKYAPLSFKATMKEQWADTLVNGKIYMLPQTFKELDAGAEFYREDLRKKFNIPEIKTVADLMVYAQTLKKNGIVSPLEANSGIIFQLYLSSHTEYTRTKFANVADASGDLVNLSLNDSTKLSGLLDADFVTAFKQTAKEMKAAYDSGVLPKNAFAQKTAAIDLFKAEKTTVLANAFENYPQYESDAKAKGWELGCLPILGPSGTSGIRPSTGNGFAFSPVSKNYERALMALDRLDQDPAYNMLIAFGIEGKNYVMKDGKLSLGPDIDAAKNPYGMYQSGWWANNRDQWPPLENYSQNYVDAKKKLQDAAKPNILNGFNANTETIKTEIANCVNVATQYELPIMYGMVKDSDAAVDQLIEKLKAAGAQKIVDEFNKQVAEFVKAHTN